MVPNSVVLLVSELVVSLVVLVGGGFLVKDPTVAATYGSAITAAWGAVIAYWFARRQQDANQQTVTQTVSQAITAAVTSLHQNQPPTPTQSSGNPNPPPGMSA